MSEDLKPCPCCESESHLSEYSDDFRRGTVYSIWCSKCGLHTKDYSRKEEAIKAWHNRPSPWHTGTPTEDGWYLIQTRITFAVAHMDKTGIRYDENGYWLEIYPTDIVAWQKIEPYRDHKERINDNQSQ